jgi:hypothetical protein
MTRLPRLALLAALAAAPAAPLTANEFEPALRALAADGLAAIAQDPAVIAALREANAGPAPGPEEIARLDRDWRAQVGTADAPLVEAVAASPASAVLRAAREDSAGLLTEIFAMDAAGLTAAMSDPTSDYWQGDEAKWRETYPAGPGAVHVSEVEFDESAQTYQAQVSLTVADGMEALGAMTFGVNVELLP